MCITVQNVEMHFAAAPKSPRAIVHMTVPLSPNGTHYLYINLYILSCFSDTLERLEMRDTVSVTSGDPEGTINSLVFASRNHIEQEETVDGIPGKRTGEDFSTDSASNSAHNCLGTKAGKTAFVADSGETSSCGSFPEITNGVIMYDRNYSLSPPPISKGDNLQFLNPNYGSGNVSESPVNASLENSPTADVQIVGNVDQVSAAEKPCDSPPVVVSDDYSTPLKTGAS